MRQLLKKSLASIAIAVFFVSGFSQFISLPVEAAPLWNRITPEDFGDNSYAVAEIAHIGDKAFFVRDESAGTTFYKYDLDTDTLEADNYIVQEEGIEYTYYLAAANGVVYLVGYNGDDDELWSYNPNTEVWTDITPNMPGDFDGYIDYITEYNGQLFIQIVEFNGENSYNSAYLYNGSSFTLVADDSSFAPISDSDWYVEDIVNAGGQMYALVEDNDSGDMRLYRRVEGTTWVEAANALQDLNDLTYFAGDIYVLSDHYEVDLTVYVLDIDESEWDEIASDFDNAVYGELAVHDGYLYLGTGHDGYASQLYRSDDGSLWELYSEFVGDEEPIEESLEVHYTTEMISFADGLLIGGSAFGEGYYFPNVWYLVDGDANDNDTIPQEVENAGPNGGDANNDGTLDSQQANVNSFVNPVTSNYVVLQHTCEATMEVSINEESSNDLQDSAFSYPVGMMNMLLICDEGETATITQIFFGEYNAEEFIARKFNTITDVYTTISEAVIDNVSIGGQPALRVVYQVTDGGELDDDGEVNGQISDPAGPALNAAGVPNTGIGGRL